MSVNVGEPWPLCFAGQHDDGAPLAEVWCSRWPETGNIDYSISIRGELSERSAVGIAPALASLESVAAIVTLDLSEVCSIDADGLALIHEMIARIARSGGRCTITTTSEAYDRAARTRHPRPPSNGGGSLLRR